MMPAARLQAVIDLLTEIANVPRPADTLAAAYFRARRFIGSKDRSAISTQMYRILRHYHRLSWWIGKAGQEVTPRTLALAEIMFDGATKTDADDIFSGGKYAPAPMSAPERKLVAFLEGKDFYAADMPLRVRTECPEWAFEPLQAALGDGFEAEMTAMQGEAPLDLRVNLLKAKRDDVLAQLIDGGMDAEAGVISPLCVRVRGRPPIARHPLFLDGAVEIQDQGSQMVAVLADAKPGEMVADFCAGAGGKTLAMGASMNNKGRIVAMDVLGGRLNRAKERFRRAGLHNIETRDITSENDKYVKRSAGTFDLVLVDAPCTGTGTWRRDPDKRFRMIGPGLVELVPLQKRILESAARLVKPGGRLVYATCSLLPEENEKQVEAFLSEHPEFSARGEALRLTPAQNDTDGFFAAMVGRAPKKS